MIQKNCKRQHFSMGKTAICNPFALWRRAVTPKYIYKNLKWNMDSMSKCKNSKWGCGTHLYLYIPLLKSNFNTKSFQWLYLSICLVFFFFWTSARMKFTSSSGRRQMGNNISARVRSIILFSEANVCPQLSTTQGQGKPLWDLVRRDNHV